MPGDLLDQGVQGGLRGAAGEPVVVHPQVAQLGQGGELGHRHRLRELGADVVQGAPAQGDVVLQGFVNSRETEERLVARIRELKGVKSVKTLLKVEERK